MRKLALNLFLVVALVAGIAVLPWALRQPDPASAAPEAARPLSPADTYDIHMPIVAKAFAPTYLQVAHLAPFAADPGTAVTVTLNGNPVLTDFVYGDSTGYVVVSAGEYLVEVFPGGSTTAAISGTVQLEAGKNYTAIAAGDGDNQDLSLVALEDDLTPPAAGTFHLRLGHLAPFDTGMAAADIRLQDGTPVLTDVVYSAVTGFIPLPAGEYDLKITTPGGGTTLIDPLPVTFNEGDIVSAFATGEDDNQDLGVFAMPAGQPGDFLPLNIAYLQAAHLAPFAMDPGTAVTVTLNGVAVLTDFAYGDSTGYIPLEPGTYLAEVWPAGSPTAAISGTFDLMGGKYYTAIAAGDGTNQELSLVALEDDLTPPAAGTFHLRLGHLAPFASGDATADIRLQDGTPVLTDVVYSAVTGFIPLPAGEYDLKITTPGGGMTLIDPAPVTFNEGDIVSAFATGEGANQDLGIFAMPAGQEGDFLPLATYLQVAHLAPFAMDPGTAVTVTLNGVPALTDFAYGDSTEYVALAEGEYLVEVFPGGSTTAAISGTVDLEAGKNYTAIATGDADNQELSLIALEDDLTPPAAGKFHLRLGHLAPFDTGDATADIRLQDGTPVLTDVVYSAVTPFIPLDAGEYNLKITTPGGGTMLIDLAPVTFNEGDIVSAFATGEGVNQDLGVFALPAGQEGFFLPLMSYLQVAHLAPFAADPGTAVTVTLNGVPALTDFEYGDSTGYVELAPGTYLAEVWPAGSTTAAISGTVDLEGAKYYTAIAAGDGTNQGLSLIALEDDLTPPAAGKFHLRLGHLAPFDTGTATADIRLQDGTPVLTDVVYSAVTGYIPLDEGLWDLKITTPGGGTTLIDPLPVMFSEGDIVSAFATGEGTNQDLGVFAMPAGQVGSFLPLVPAP